MSHVGCSITVQSPQGSVSGQFSLEVKPGSTIFENVTLLPDESVELDLPENLALLAVNSDFPSVAEVGDARHELTGIRRGGQPLFVYHSFCQCKGIGGGEKLKLSNPATSYSEIEVDGVKETRAQGKRVSIQVLTAAQKEA